MFRLFVFAIFLLVVGCHSGEAPVSQVVTLPLLPRDFYVQLEDGCEWQQEDFAVFNQNTQRLKFKSKFCPNQEHIRRSYSIENTNTVMFRETYSYNKEIGFYFPIIILHKLGSLTEEGFVKNQMPASALYNDFCKVEQVVEGVWLVKSTFETTVSLFDEAGVMKIPKDPCGERSHHKENTWGGEFFVIKDGIVFQIMNSGLGQYIDLSSITYENRG